MWRHNRQPSQPQGQSPPPDTKINFFALPAWGQTTKKQPNLPLQKNYLLSCLYNKLNLSKSRRCKYEQIYNDNQLFYCFYLMQLQEKLFANLELRICWDWDWSPAHHAERTLSTDSETRRLHLPLEQTVGSSSTAALEDNESFKCFCFCDGRNSYQRIDEAPQGRH